MGECRGTLGPPTVRPVESHDYRPRPHDELVEPFLKGLGDANAPAAPPPAAQAPPPAHGALAALRRFLSGLFRTSAPEERG